MHLKFVKSASMTSGIMQKNMGIKIHKTFSWFQIGLGVFFLYMALEK
jgi:hypothetical protein